ncbi:MAG: substrate-binding domain-containing protein [Verrucomicrobia bacterium]|nr:substrate-binding domain-containing protein [Verrucomicrobiota bacterium]
MDYSPRLSPRHATLEDVAAHCGVSYQTVSRVVNRSPLVAEKTRAQVLKAIAELDYRPNLAARRLATRRSSLIGMIGTNLTQHGPAQVMVSIEETAKRSGHNLMFAGVPRPSKAQLAAAIDDLCEHQVDGLVLGVKVRGSIDLVRKRCRGVPFVSLDDGAAADVPTVIIDQQYGLRLATHHLLDLGHRQIACISGPRGWSASKERRWAWAQTLRSAGLEPGPCLQGDWSAASGYAAAVQLLAAFPRRFTAIVAANDHMALGALRALHAKGIRIPGDVSLVGYDDLPESRFFEPPLTTVHHDFAGQGERCVEVLLRMINRQPIQLPLERLRPELVIRESTAVAPSSF